MTRDILNRIAKESKINLNYYDHVNAWINENYTKVFVEFFCTENVGGTQIHCCQRYITKSVCAICKREEDPAAYTTQGSTWISEIRQITMGRQPLPSNP